MNLVEKFKEITIEAQKDKWLHSAWMLALAEAIEERLKEFELTHKTTCWHCKYTFGYSGVKYRDIYCPNCLAMNSIYSPAAIINEMEEKEVQVGVDYENEKYQGRYVYLPRIGETAEFDIKEIREVKSDNAKLNFTEDVPVMQDGIQVIDDDGEPVFKKKDLGYHIAADLQNGKQLTITGMSAFLAVFKKFNVQDGDRITVNHVERGKWEVEKAPRT